MSNEAVVVLCILCALVYLVVGFNAFIYLSMDCRSRHAIAVAIGYAIGWPIFLLLGAPFCLFFAVKDLIQRGDE